MKAHQPKTALFWADVERKSQEYPVTQADYEEWRSNPVTMALYDDLEFETLKSQSDLATNAGLTSYELVSAQKICSGMTVMLENVFSWRPEGIELEDDYDS